MAKRLTVGGLVVLIALAGGGIALAQGEVAVAPFISWASGTSSGGGFVLEAGRPVPGVASGGGFSLAGGITAASPTDTGFVRPIAYLPSVWR